MSDLQNKTTMSVERALEINSALVGAYMLMEALGDPPHKAVRFDFTAAEAEEASRMMQDRPEIGRTKRADGTTRLTCHVEPTRVRSLFAWAVATWADSGADRG